MNGKKQNLSIKNVFGTKCVLPNTWFVILNSVGGRFHAGLLFCSSITVQYTVGAVDFTPGFFFVLLLLCSIQYIVHIIIQLYKNIYKITVQNI